MMNGVLTRGAKQKVILQDGSTFYSQLVRCTVWCDWFPVRERTDNWPDGRQSVRFGQFLVNGVVKLCTLKFTNLRA